MIKTFRKYSGQKILKNNLFKLVMNKIDNNYKILNEIKLLD